MVVQSELVHYGHSSDDVFTVFILLFGDGQLIFLRYLSIQGHHEDSGDELGTEDQQVEQQPEAQGEAV